MCLPCVHVIMSVHSNVCVVDFWSASVVDPIENNPSTWMVASPQKLGVVAHSGLLIPTLAFVSGSCGVEGPLIRLYPKCAWLISDGVKICESVSPSTRLWKSIFPPYPGICCGFPPTKLNIAWYCGVSEKKNLPESRLFCPIAWSILVVNWSSWNEDTPLIGVVTGSAPEAACRAALGIAQLPSGNFDCSNLTLIGLSAGIVAPGP